MKLTPPKALTFWISVLLVVVGALAFSMGGLSFITMPIAVIIIVVGFVLLALGNMIKGL